MSFASSIDLTPDQSSLTNALFTTASAGSYTITANSSSVDVLTIPSLPAGTYLFNLNVGCSVLGGLTSAEITLNEDPLNAGQIYYNQLITTNDGTNLIFNGDAVTAGTFPITGNGLVVLPTASPIYVYIELNTATANTATSWTPTNFYVSYVKIA
jgi:hypothetical protein